MGRPASGWDRNIAAGLGLVIVFQLEDLSGHRPKDIGPVVVPRCESLEREPYLPPFGLFLPLVRHVVPFGHLCPAGGKWVVKPS